MRYNIRFPVDLGSRIKEKGHKVSTFIRFALEKFFESPEISIPKDYQTAKTMITLPDDLFYRLEDFSKTKNLPVSKIIFMAVEAQLKKMEKHE